MDFLEIMVPASASTDNIGIKLDSLAQRFINYCGDCDAIVGVDYDTGEGYCLCTLRSVVPRVIFPLGEAPAEWWFVPAGDEFGSELATEFKKTREWIFEWTGVPVNDLGIEVSWSWK